jgi:predicted enzyme related to lactoylglutathione lyase
MIDCLDSEFEASLEFWAEALGLPPGRRPRKNQRYLTLGTIETPLVIQMQRVTSQPGYHLDFESDDMAAEVSRLEKNGARYTRRVKRWYVAQDPSGNAFCVVRPQSDEFLRHAKRWET